MKKAVIYGSALASFNVSENMKQNGEKVYEIVNSIIVNVEPRRNLKYGNFFAVPGFEDSFYFDALTVHTLSELLPEK